MNLRFPIVVALVAAAAGAAALRAGHPAAPVAPFVSESSRMAAAGAVPQHSANVRRGIVVYVAGDVRHDGLYTLQAGARTSDALRAAGGPGQDADLVSVNLAQELSDGDEVAVPSLADSTGTPVTGSRTHRTHRAKHRKHGHKRKHRRHRPAATLAAGDTASAASLDPTADTSGADRSANDAPVSLVDLNTADEAELETLPGVGATLAERIVSFRELTGPFASPDDLLDVAGLSQSKLDAIEPYLTLGPGPASP